MKVNEVSSQRGKKSKTSQPQAVQTVNKQDSLFYRNPLTANKPTKPKFQLHKKNKYQKKKVNKKTGKFKKKAQIATSVEEFLKQRIKFVKGEGFLPTVNDVKVEAEISPKSPPIVTPKKLVIDDINGSSIDPLMKSDLLHSSTKRVPDKTTKKSLNINGSKTLQTNHSVMKAQKQAVTPPNKFLQVTTTNKYIQVVIPYLPNIAEALKDLMKHCETISCGYRRCSFILGLAADKVDDILKKLSDLEYHGMKLKIYVLHNTPIEPLKKRIHLSVANLEEKLKAHYQATQVYHIPKSKFMYLLHFSSKEEADAVMKKSIQIKKRVFYPLDCINPQIIKKGMVPQNIPAAKKLKTNNEAKPRVHEE